MSTVVNLFWQLVHHLPWSITRHICDMCDEFGADPKKIVADASLKWGVTQRPVVGWTCDHMTMTASGGYLGALTTWCGCDMEPIYDDRPRNFTA